MNPESSTQLDSRAFSGLESLKSLSLTENKISELPEVSCFSLLMALSLLGTLAAAAVAQSVTLPGLRSLKRGGTELT